jgi:hypothetical protein
MATVYGVSLGKFRKACSLALNDSEAPPHGNLCSRKERRNVGEARTWWQGFFEDFGERDPTQDIIHLPVCLTWVDIHEQYVADMVRDGRDASTLCSLQVFCKIRVQSFPNVRLCRKTWMPRCGVCIELSQNRLRCKTAEERASWMRKKRDHLALEMSERQAYRYRQNLARGQPGEYMSMIMDASTSLRLIRAHPYPKGNDWPTKSFKVFPEGIVNHSHGGLSIAFHLGQYSRDANLACTLLYLHVRFVLRDAAKVRPRCVSIYELWECISTNAIVIAGAFFCRQTTMLGRPRTEPFWAFWG